MWESIKRLMGTDLTTLDRQKPFRIVQVSDTYLEAYIDTTGRTRRIHRNQIEAAWECLQKQGILTRSQIREEFAQYNPAYVAAILAEQPGVTVELRPITLRI